MKLPINWLRDYVQVPENPKELIDKLTSIGHMQDGPPKEVAGDVVYDLEIRQNRSDCLSIIGLAREASAILNQPLKLPDDADLPDLHLTGGDLTGGDSELCHRLETLKIDNLKIGPSPEFIKQRLEAYGIKSINNIVDVTNFVMVELGEPMHAYDTREIEGVITVRLAKKGEKLTVLGGKELILTEDDLVIVDDAKILSLAGIIGGEHSGIKPDTTSIILEVATYNQASIRRTSIRHQVRTEASTRHEKFLHPEMTTVALRRAAKLLIEHAGGTIVDHTDIYPAPVQEKWIQLHLVYLQKLGGVQISIQEASEILKRLGMKLKDVTENSLTAGIPFVRTDILQEVDLIEEVLRIYGYENIPAALPAAPPPADLQQNSTYEVEEQIKNVLVSSGYDEQISEPLTNEKTSALEPVKLENSLNADKTMLRTTLKNSLMTAFIHQQKYRKIDIRIFELGKIYFKQGEAYREEKVLAGISSYPSNSFSNVKGVLEAVFERAHFVFNEDVINIETMNSATFYFEVKLSDILKQPVISFTHTLFTQPPQVILQDLSLHAPENVKVGEVISAIQKISPAVFKIKLGETPQKMKDGGKSIFLNVTFFSPHGTITNQEVEGEREKIRTMLDSDFQIKIR